MVLGSEWARDTLKSRTISLTAVHLLKQYDQQKDTKP